jgi:hypothetical protein
VLPICGLGRRGALPHLPVVVREAHHGAAEPERHLEETRPGLSAQNARSRLRRTALCLNDCGWHTPSSPPRGVRKVSGCL